jgi:hypothetical protein
MISTMETYMDVMRKEAFQCKVKRLALWLREQATLRKNSIPIHLTANILVYNVPKDICDSRWCSEPLIQFSFTLEWTTRLLFASRNLNSTLRNADIRCEGKCV